MPASMWRMTFSITTMASSTTKPMAITSAISERLSRVKPSTYITTKAPASDSGTVTPAMRVGPQRRRNSSMVRITRPRLISRLICTSSTEARMVGVRSWKGISATPAGSQARSCGMSASMLSTVAITLASACLRTSIRMARWSLCQAAW